MSDKNFPLPPVSPLLGSSFRNYLKILRGHRIEPKYYYKIFLTALVIIVSTPLRWYEKLVFSSKTKKVTIKKPVFIIGHWRSGTTYLHNLLCQDTQTSYVATYQTVFPHFLASKFVFGPVMNKFMPKKRPSDNMELSMNFPQEEEFAFLNTNPHSIYNFCYFPEDYKQFYEQAVHHQGLSQKAVAKIAHDYTFLLKKALVAGGNGRLVIKNPVNTARIGFLLQEFPDAAFIHIIRNPYIIYLSTTKFFSNLFPTMWFHEVSRDDIKLMVIDLYTRLYDDFFAQKEKIRQNCLEIKFEELEEQPVKVLEQVYTELGLAGFTEALPHIQAYIDEHRHYQKNTYKISRAEVTMIEQHWQKYIDHWGYSLPDNLEIVD